MKQLVIFCALCALLGCRVADVPENEEVALYCSPFEQSKTDVLTSGDPISVFACTEGMEDYFLAHAKFIVGPDGHTLTYGSAVYYPDRKAAVRFFACFPYHTGVFSVPSDQSTALALKQADLCWAAARSTPAKTAVPLQFTHQMARLLVTTNTPTTKIVAPNVFSGGRLDIKTGVFTNTLQSSISTTGTGTSSELILPAQTFTRLVLTVSGVEYVFAPVAPIDLPAAQTTAISLTLNASSKTAALSSSTSTTTWGVANKTDAASRTVSNQFTAYWLVADYRFSQINKIGLTVKDETSGATKEYPVSQVALVGGSTMASASYTFTLANVPELHYPYTVSAIQFYQNTTLVHRASVGNVVARTGGATLGSGQNIALTLSADKASVAAAATSSAFALTSNVPYGSSYTAGGASVQGAGTEPPYTNCSVVFTYPAQGAVAAAARTHVMTITPTVDYTGAPNKRTFTVTQAAVPTALTISAAAPGRNVLRTGETFVINVTANTSWKSQSAVNGVTTDPASGTGSVTGVKVIVPATAASTTRTVSIDFITTAALSGITEMTKKWSGTQDIGVLSNAILINGVWWATGNLVADGVNGCKIGAPGDGGLYFQFGSLIGWSGGSSGTGVGLGQPALDKVVWPVAMGATKPSFAWQNNNAANIATLSNYYFNYSSGSWGTANSTSADIGGFAETVSGQGATAGNLRSGRYAKLGVGDPCRYYLGGTWRLPTGEEYGAMCNKKTVIGQQYSWSDVGGTWVSGSGGNFANKQLFLPASGLRSSLDGLFGYVTVYGFGWSSSIYNGMSSFNLSFYSSWVYPQSNSLRSYGFFVRCVSN